MNAFSIKYRRVATIDNPPAEGGGSGEAENDDDDDDGQVEVAGEPDIGLGRIIEAIDTITKMIEALSDRMDSFVDAGATVRETDDENVEDEDEDGVDEEDLETPIEDMDFSLDDENND